MRKVFMYLIMASVVTTVLPAKGAEDGPLTSKQADEIINELREIRKLLEAQVSNQSATRSTAQPRSRTIALDVTGAPVLGSKDAPLAIVQFTDFQCPYCNRFFKEVLPDLKKNYIDTGKVRFYAWTSRSRSTRTLCARRKQGDAPPIRINSGPCTT
ncbi:MAG TPA: thioredoxin domain-containing protein [Bryobacteraceae bacterium]|jgi:protein-disulfide isomerase|nr:thioredoxin domain-containing protein [Bryobacteraceae bacterium]